MAKTRPAVTLAVRARKGRTGPKVREPDGHLKEAVVLQAEG